MKRLLLAALLLPGAALAHEYALGDITVDHPMIFETPANAPVAGGYMSITNAGPDDRLVAVRVDPEIAGTMQLHEMTVSDGIMRMSEVEGGIALPSGETVALEQGGLHVMFMQLQQRLVDGDEVPATLVFEEAGELEVVFNVETRGARDGEMDHGGMSHGEHDSDG